MFNSMKHICMCENKLYAHTSTFLVSADKSTFSKKKKFKGHTNDFVLNGIHNTILDYIHITTMTTFNGVHKTHNGGKPQVITSQCHDDDNSIDIIAPY